MKIHTDDHLAVILLHATGVTGEALLDEMRAAMIPVTSAGRRMRETKVNMVPLRVCPRRAGTYSKFYGSGRCAAVRENDGVDSQSPGAMWPTIG